MWKIHKYSEARVRHPLLSGTKASKEEWERVLDEVTAMGLEAPAASSTAARHGELRKQLSYDAGGCARAAKVARLGEAGKGLGERRRWASTRLRRRA
jgi:hypothetical protein